VGSKCDVSTYDDIQSEAILCKPGHSLWFERDCRAVILWKADNFYEALEFADESGE